MDENVNLGYDKEINKYIDLVQYMGITKREAIEKVNHLLNILEVGFCNERYRKEKRIEKTAKYSETIKDLEEAGHKINFDVLTVGYRIPILRSDWKIFTKLGIPKEMLQNLHNKIWKTTIESLSTINSTWRTEEARNT